MAHPLKVKFCLGLTRGNMLCLDLVNFIRFLHRRNRVWIKYRIRTRVRVSTSDAVVNIGGGGQWIAWPCLGKHVSLADVLFDLRNKFMEPCHVYLLECLNPPPKLKPKNNSCQSPKTFRVRFKVS